MLKPHGYNFYHALVLMILFSEYYDQFMNFFVLRKILYFVLDQEADVTAFLCHTDTYKWDPLVSNHLTIS